MAPPTDHFQHYTSAEDGALSLALLLANAVLLSAAILLYCSICKRKTADFTSSRISKERAKSELKKVTVLRESEIREIKGTSNGVIPSGAGKSQKSKNTEKNGSVVKDGGQVSLELQKRVLPLPPVSPPQEDEGSLYEMVVEEPHALRSSAPQTDAEENEKHLDNTSKNIKPVNGGDVHNPEILENHLYSPIRDGWRERTSETQKSIIPSPAPNQSDKTMMEPMYPSLIPDEPIYAIVRKDKPSIKKPPVIPNENVSKDSGVKIEPQDGFTHKNTDSLEDPMISGVPVTSSFKVNNILNHWKKKSFKSSPPQPMVSLNIDLEEPPPVPDKLFDIENERHPNKDNLGTEIELED